MRRLRPACGTMCAGYSLKKKGLKPMGACHTCEGGGAGYSLKKKGLKRVKSPKRFPDRCRLFPEEEGIETQCNGRGMDPWVVPAIP